MSCTLLLVSRSIHDEVHPLLGLLRNKVQELFADTLHYNHFKSPSPEFLQYCPALRFVFDSTRSWIAFTFMTDLPEFIKPLIRDVIFAKGCLARLRDDLTGKWQLDSPQNQYWLHLLLNLPHLKTLGFEVSIKDNQLQPNTLAALRMGTDLLQERKIDVLHLFYREEQQYEFMPHARKPIRIETTPDSLKTKKELMQCSPQSDVSEMIQGFKIAEIRPWTLEHNQPWLSDERYGAHRQHVVRLMRVTRQA